MKIRVNKTSRREGFHQLRVPKAPKVKQIGSSLGPIKPPKVPKMKMPQYGC